MNLHNIVLTAMKQLQAEESPLVLPGGRWCYSPESQLALMRANRRLISEWAKGRLADTNAAYLDTETTGLVFGQDEVVELTLVSYNGKVLFSQMFRPKAQMKPDAFEKNGITQEELKKLAPISNAWKQILHLINGKQILAWNSEFDREILRGTAIKHNLVNVERPEGYVKPTWTCLMKAYSVFNNSYRWWRLTEMMEQEKLLGVTAPHAAISDTLALYDLVQTLALHDPDDVILPENAILSQQVIDAINTAIKEYAPIQFKYKTQELPLKTVDVLVYPRALFQSSEGVFYLMGGGHDSDDRTYRLDKAIFDPAWVADYEVAETN